MTFLYKLAFSVGWLAFIVAVYIHWPVALVAAVGALIGLRIRHERRERKVRRAVRRQLRERLGGPGLPEHPMGRCDAQPTRISDEQWEEIGRQLHEAARRRGPLKEPPGLKEWTMRLNYETAIGNTTNLSIGVVRFGDKVYQGPIPGNSINGQRAANYRWN